MKEPVFLDLDEVLAMHADQIELYGGSLGVRDLGLLESALAMPRATFGGNFLHGSIHEMAAAYFFHLLKDHPFVDGNKRIGVEAALIFLSLNDLWVKASYRELADVGLGVAEGKLTKSDVAVWIRDHSVPFGSSRTHSS